jgi:hypothetical protein
MSNRNAFFSAIEVGFSSTKVQRVDQERWLHNIVDVEPDQFAGYFVVKASTVIR